MWCTWGEAGHEPDHEHGRTRWRCKTCGASTVRRRVDVTRRAHLALFINWLRSPEVPRRVRRFDLWVSASWPESRVVQGFGLE